MARRSKKRQLVKKKAKLDDVRAEINVTPLVDICLVLLIIFMIVLPLMERGRQVELPQTRNHENSEDTQEPIVVVDHVGKLYVGKDPVPDTKTMQERVQEEWRALEARDIQLGKKPEDRKGEGRVLVKAEIGTSYGKVYPIIMALHEAGAIGVDLGTNEVKEKEE